MKFVKLTILETHAILDCLLGESEDTEEAVELLSAALETAIDEEIPSECQNIHVSYEGDTAQ